MVEPSGDYLFFFFESKPDVTLISLTYYMKSDHITLRTTSLVHTKVFVDADQKLIALLIGHY